MKISVENNVATSVAWGMGPANTHWRVSYDIGIVQHGSSGSPLFDPTGRIVGQLHGNQYYNGFIPYCDQPIGEYGRFDVSWGRDASGNFLPGRNATNSLAPWLDPKNTGAMTTNTIPLATITGVDPLCTSDTYTLANLPTGATVTGWNATPSGAVSLSGTGNSRTVTRNTSYNGFVTLSATIATDCGTTTISKRIYAGRIVDYYIDGPTSIGTNWPTPYFAENTFTPGLGITSWNWFFAVPPASYSITPIGPGVAEVIVGTPGTYTLAVSVTNPCGVSEAATMDISVGSGGGGGGQPLR